MKSELVRLADDIANYARLFADAVDDTEKAISLSHLNRRVLDIQTTITKLINTNNKENNNG